MDTVYALIHVRIEFDVPPYRRDTQRTRRWTSDRRHTHHNQEGHYA